MNKTTIKTPGVYINEIDDFSKSVLPVPTAIPAFIGYTPKTTYKGKSLINRPQKVNSILEFQELFLEPEIEQQYSPQYYVVEQKSKDPRGSYMEIDEKTYAIVPDPNTVYYLYNSLRLFFENGGDTAYIVSVGSYGKPSGKPISPGDQIINPNVSRTALTTGLATLTKEEEPTMYICPEATLLSLADNSTLMESMLLQNQHMQTAISIFDIIGARNPDPNNFANDIQNFRNGTGNQGLEYGTAYYPFIGTTVMYGFELNYTNLFGGDVSALKKIISPANAPNPTVDEILKAIGEYKPSEIQNALLNASETYTQLMNHVLAEANMLPPSGAMAGVITNTDNLEGVWKAPANTSIVGAQSLSVSLNHSQQENLNVDAVSGKSINAIRFFKGRGILVWGARTLDGNSQDWRYIPVRRTMTFLEQSCKNACKAYTFELNTANTWRSVTAIISNFLDSIWKQGGLQGATAADAYSVACGLGSTMTPEDILNGTMRVSIKVAVVRPAEFMIITLEQQMQKG